MKQLVWLHFCPARENYTKHIIIRHHVIVRPSQNLRRCSFWAIILMITSWFPLVNFTFSCTRFDYFVHLWNIMWNRHRKIGFIERFVFNAFDLLIVYHTFIIISNFLTVALGNMNDCGGGPIDRIFPKIKPQRQ